MNERSFIGGHGGRGSHEGERSTLSAGARAPQAGWLSGGVVAVIAVVKRATRAQPQKSGLIPYGIAISAGGLYWCFTGGG